MPANHTQGLEVMSFQGEKATKIGSPANYPMHARDSA